MSAQHFFVKQLIDISNV